MAASASRNKAFCPESKTAGIAIRTGSCSFRRGLIPFQSAALTVSRPYVSFAICKNYVPVPPKFASGANT
jgi:hypothetical protein